MADATKRTPDSNRLYTSGWLDQRVQRVTDAKETHRPVLTRANATTGWDARRMSAQ